jgi:TolA-binding protein
VTAVEKMRVAAEAAAAAYDAAAERERILRDELAKSGGADSGQTDVARMRQLAAIKEKITWSKQAADYAHDAEETRKLTAAAADDAQRRLRELEDRVDELRRSIKAKMAEGTVHEELEHERATLLLEPLEVT